MDDSDLRDKKHVLVEYDLSEQVYDEYEGVHVYKKFNNIDLYEHESSDFQNDFAK